MSDVIASEGESQDEPGAYLILGHVCSAVVHQVVNALSAIVSQAEALKARADPDGLPCAEIAARADAMIKAALDGSSLARNLADFSRDATALDAGGAALEVVDLNRLAAECVEAHRRRPGPKIAWNVGLAPTAKLPGNEAQLRGMLDALLGNARESLRDEGGAIEVTTAVDALGGLVLEIRDDGSGMPTEVRERAFEPFFSTKPGGSGLGLALARGVWRRHRGSLTIESTPGRGTLVRLTRPPESTPGGVGVGAV